MSSRYASLFYSKIWLVLAMFVFMLLGTIKLIKFEEDKERLELTVARLQDANSALQHSLLEKSNSKASQEENDIIVIYNRVPKTASTSFVNVAYDLCKRNGFNVLHLNVTKNYHVLSLSDQARFVYNVTHWNAKKPGLYHGHVAFINFEKFGSRQQPIYINLIRKPLDRLVSYYYFLRYGDNYRPHLVRNKHGDTTTFDDCVKNRHQDCDPSNMWLQIPFLCGHAPGCWEPGNRWALEEAKRNLLNKYLLVGVTEQLPEFIAVLEGALPTFFKGALNHFLSSKKNHLRRTNLKFPPSEETIGIIKRTAIWKMENELYEFALEQFNFTKKRMQVGRDGMLIDRGRQFTFEKISPK